MSIKQIKTPELGTDAVRIYWDSDLREYSVKVTGKPEATYFTDDKSDALATAQYMRNNELAHLLD